MADDKKKSIAEKVITTAMNFIVKNVATGSVSASAKAIKARKRQLENAGDEQDRESAGTNIGKNKMRRD